VIVPTRTRFQRSVVRSGEQFVTEVDRLEPRRPLGHQLGSGEPNCKQRAASRDAAVKLTHLVNLEFFFQKFRPILRDRRKLHLVSGVVPDQLLRFARRIEECLGV
jgi:hypothetical protein